MARAREVFYPFVSRLHETENDYSLGKPDRYILLFFFLEKRTEPLTPIAGLLQYLPRLTVWIECMACCLTSDPSPPFLPSFLFFSSLFDLISNCFFGFTSGLNHYVVWEMPDNMCIVDFAKLEHITLL